MTDTPIITDKEIEAILDMMAEQDRLRSLTNAELVAECAGMDAADYLIVEEMMDRLEPDWFKDKGKDS
jgi:hypothetical protein